MSPPYDALNFTLASLDDLSDEVRLRSLISLLLTVPPKEFVPTKIGRYPPLNTDLDPNDIAGVLQFYGIPLPTLLSSVAKEDPETVVFMQFAEDGEYTTHWTRLRNPIFAFVSGTFPWKLLLNSIKIDRCIEILKALIPVVNPVYGEFRNMLFPCPPYDFETRLPHVPWISIYGKPYIDMFTEERIISAPFLKIERLPSGHFFLQATQSPSDPVSEDLQDAIRRHLGEDAFMAGVRWRYKNGQAPEFNKYK